MPATKRNNRVFSHIYDLSTTIEEDRTQYNPYVKTIATLLEDSTEIFQGELTLGTIKDNTIKEIWNNKKYLHIFNSHKNNERSKVFPCDRCPA